MTLTCIKPEVKHISREIIKLRLRVATECILIATMEHFGQKIKRMYLLRHWSQKVFADKVGIRERTLINWEKMETPESIRGANYLKLAAAFNMSAEQLDAELGVNESMDQNIDPYSEVYVPDIPTFDMPIAAGPWMELADVNASDQKSFAVDGRFRIRIRGDSMEKAYHDESLIEFQCMRPERGDGKGIPEIGKDYYIQRAESATFKRLESANNDALTFVAINRKKYPDKIRVLREDIVCMAKAVFILTPA